MPYNYKTELERYRRYYQSLEPLLNKKKSQNYTAVIFSFLVISLFGLYAIRPTIGTILTLKREIQDKIEINKKMEEKISALIEAQAVYSQIENNLPFIDQALPSDPEAIPLIVQLQNLATLHGVSIATVQLPPVPLLGKESTTSAKIQAIGAKQESFTFTISIVGPYSGILEFITGLLEMRRVVTLGTVSVVTDRSNEKASTISAQTIGSQLKLTMKLTSYYFSH